MVTLAEALAVLYPDASPQADYTVADDGTGPRLARWDAARLGPEPAAEAVAAVTPAQAEAARVGRSVADAGAVLVAGDDPVTQAVRVTVRVLTDAVNVRLRAVGQPPILEADLMPAIAAGLAAGLSLPGPREDA